MLASLGSYSFEIIPVEVQVIQNEMLVDIIGSRSPRHVGRHWSGHAVLWIPEMGTIFDPTIGQGRFATTDDLRVPALVQDSKLSTRPPAGTGWMVNRRDRQTSLVYTVVDGGEPYETNVEYPSVRASIEAVVERKAGVFAAQVQEGRALLLKRKLG